MTKNKLPSLGELENFLRTNGFYSYQESEKVIANYQNSLEKAIKNSSHSGIDLKMPVKEITDYGSPRKVLIMHLKQEVLKLFWLDITNPLNFTIDLEQTFRSSANKSYSPASLYENIERQLKAFLDENQYASIHDCILIFAHALKPIWRKDGQLEGVCQGLDKMKHFLDLDQVHIGEELEEYLQQNSFPNIKISCINDSLAVLLSAKAVEISQSLRFDDCLSLLVSAGTNLSLKLENRGFTTLINSEFGNFQGTKQSVFDQEIEQAEGLEKNYHNEKMIAGKWLAQVFIKIHQSLLDQQLLDSNLWQDFKHTTLKSEDIQKMHQSQFSDPERQKIFRWLWQEVIRRAATLCGLAVTARLMQIDRQTSSHKRLKIALIENGQVMEKGQHFREIMVKTINNELILHQLGDRFEIHYYHPKKADVLGALILNTIIHKQ